MTMRVLSALLAASVVALLLATPCAAKPQAPLQLTQRQQQPQGNGYLVPIVRGFANNQILGLKEVLALGQVLGRTVVLTGLIESPAEQQPGAYPRTLPYDQVFEREGIAALQPVTTLPEMRAAGWNASLDLVIFFAGQGSDELWLRRWAAAFNVTTSATPHLEMHGFRCDDNWLQRLRETVKGKQVVGVSSFEGIVGAHVRHPGLEWRYEDVKGRQTPCQRSYVEVTRVLGKSAHIQRLVDTFVARELRNNRFVALHVRPYPDACIKIWQRRSIDRQQAEHKGACLHPANKFSLDLILGPAMAAAMRTVGASLPLFVMADPRIRHNVDRLLRQHGLQPKYLSLDTVMHDAAMDAAAAASAGAAGAASGQVPMLISHAVLSDAPSPNAGSARTPKPGSPAVTAAVPVEGSDEAEQSPGVESGAADAGDDAAVAADAPLVEAPDAEEGGEDVYHDGDKVAAQGASQGQPGQQAGEEAGVAAYGGAQQTALGGDEDDSGMADGTGGDEGDGEHSAQDGDSDEVGEDVADPDSAEEGARDMRRVRRVQRAASGVTAAAALRRVWPRVAAEVPSLVRYVEKRRLAPVAVSGSGGDNIGGSGGGSRISGGGDGGDSRSDAAGMTGAVAHLQQGQHHDRLPGQGNAHQQGQGQGQEQHQGQGREQGQDQGQSQGQGQAQEQGQEEGQGQEQEQGQSQGQGQAQEQGQEEGQGQDQEQGQEGGQGQGHGPSEQGRWRRRLGKRSASKPRQPSPPPTPPPQEWERALELQAGAISLLGMVEEEVAVRSLFFFATTGYSSMAGMVIQQRHALGMPRNATITFDQLGSLDPDSWPEPWSGTET